MNTDDDLGDEMSRRSFLISASGVTLGTFMLPALQTDVTGGTRFLLSAPIKGQLVGHPYLMWQERLGDKIEMMIWSLRSESDIAEGERLYEAANSIDWSSVGEQGVPDETIGLPPRADDRNAVDDGELDVDRGTENKDID